MRLGWPAPPKASGELVRIVLRVLGADVLEITTDPDPGSDRGPGTGSADLTVSQPIPFGFTPHDEPLTED